jgi:hypothetical protein
MASNSHVSLRMPLRIISLFTLMLFAFFFCASLASINDSLAMPGKAETILHIEVQDAQGVRVAGPQVHILSTKPVSAELVFDREYQPGDRILFAGPQRTVVQMDATLPECLLYLSGRPGEIVSYEIPYGREENQTGSAYAPESFAGKSHRVIIRALSKSELSGYRNLALNPCDARESEKLPVQVYPHASTNSVSRSLFDFEARNAIDGIAQNGHHGIWPYQSWGPQLRTDLWWKLDFGRPVELDKIRLTVRADFPHDSYWKSADVEFSDGSHISIKLTDSPGFQDFSFAKRRASWLRLTNLVPADPAKWCSFIEVEAWGHDLK